MSGIMLDDNRLRFRLGQKWDGRPPQFGAIQDFMGEVTEFDLDIRTDKTDTRGAGEKTARNRYHTDEGTMKLTGVVLQEGFTFKQPGELNPVRRWIEVYHAPSSTMDVDDVWLGVITSWHPNGKKGDAFVEDIEIDLTPVGAPATI